MMDDGWWTPMTARTKEITDMPMQSDLARWAESMATGRPVPDAPTPTPSQIAKREALLMCWIDVAQRDAALLWAIELV
jgi:hypothetical protein